MTRRKPRIALSAITVLAAGVGVAESAYALSPAGDAFNVYTYDSTAGLDVWSSSTAVAADGSGVAAWLHEDWIANTFVVMASRIGANGGGLGPVLTLASGSDVTNPLVASDAAGNFVVAWSGGYFQLFDASSQALGSPMCVQSCQLGRASGLAMDNAGNFAVLSYGGNLSPNTYLINRFKPDGTPRDTQPIVLDKGSVLDHVALSMNRTTGAMTVAWEHSTRTWLTPFKETYDHLIQVQRFDSNGKTVGLPATVVNCVEHLKATEGGFGQYSGCHPLWLSIAQDDTGSSVVAWGDSEAVNFADTYSINARGYASNGFAKGPKVVVHTLASQTYNAYGYVSVTAGAVGSFALAWPDVYTGPDGAAHVGTVLQGINADGSLDGNSFGEPDNASQPAIAANSSGKLLHDWPDGFAEDGLPVGNNAHFFTMP